MSFKYCERPCRYRAGEYDKNGCNYMLVTGTMRGCPAGEGCTRFEEGERIDIREIESRIPSMERKTAAEIVTDLYIMGQKGRMQLAAQKGRKY